MAKIAGRLIADLLSDGTVRIVFLSNNGDKNDYPVKETGIETAELLFMACGLSAEDAAQLRAEIYFNKVAGVDISVDSEVAATFWHTFPSK